MRGEDGEVRGIIVVAVARKGKVIRPERDIPGHSNDRSS